MHAARPAFAESFDVVVVVVVAVVVVVVVHTRAAFMRVVSSSFFFLIFFFIIFRTRSQVQNVGGGRSPRRRRTRRPPKKEKKNWKIFGQKKNPAKLAKKNLPFSTSKSMAKSIFKRFPLGLDSGSRCRVTLMDIEYYWWLFRRDFSSGKKLVESKLVPSEFDSIPNVFSSVRLG